MTFRPIDTKLYEEPEAFFEFNKTEQLPEVSVIVTCFNHAAFIEDCLKSIFEQTTPFNFEVLIGDDSSFDNSLEKCVATARKFNVPSRIFKWSASSKSYHNGRPNGKLNFLRLYRLARATTFARCDGDDFWISKDKLRIQNDFLKNTDYSIVFGKSRVGESIENSTEPNQFVGEYSLEDIQWHNITGYSSSTAFWRDPDKEESILLRMSTLWSSPYGDWLIQLLALRTGKKGYVLNKTIGFYRQHAKGVYSALEPEKKLLHSYHAHCINEYFFPEFNSAEQFDHWLEPQILSMIKKKLANDSEDFFLNFNRSFRAKLICILLRNLFKSNRKKHM